MKLIEGLRVNNFILIKKEQLLWQCLCDCGTNFSSISKNISRGKVSCGLCIVSSNGTRVVDKTITLYRSKIRTYKDVAKRRSLKWELEESLAIKLFQSKCHYCKQEPAKSLSVYKNNRKGLRDVEVLVNGIDRINNDAHYTQDNVVPCCFICNRAKSNLDYKDFLNWINKIGR